MDCRTARLLLDFARPQTSELESEEAAALESHLDHCPDCHTQARGERQLDDVLGKAMRQVEVPAELRDQLLARLESERGDWYRQRFAHAVRLVVATAAAMLLLVWGAWYWLHDRAPAPIDPGRVTDAINLDTAVDPQTRTEEALRRLGVDTHLPQSLDFHFLACPPAMAELPGYPGRKVPMLVFTRNGQVARMYLVREKAIPDGTPNKIGGGTFKAELLSAGEPYRLLVIHDGADIDWLRLPDPPPA